MASAKKIYAANVYGSNMYAAGLWRGVGAVTPITTITEVSAGWTAPRSRLDYEAPRSRLDYEARKA